jgi:hypothetical protein
MIQAGPNSPGTVIQVKLSIGPDVEWYLPNNVKVSDNNYASAALESASTYWLKCTNFGFTLPLTAIIGGILVQAEVHKSGPGLIVQTFVEIVKDDVIGGTTGTGRGNTNYWLEADQVREYGNSNDLWNETWTPADINSATFGAALACQSSGGADAWVDHIQITVYYTEITTSSSTTITTTSSSTTKTTSTTLSTSITTTSSSTTSTHTSSSSKSTTITTTSSSTTTTSSSTTVTTSSSTTHSTSTTITYPPPSLTFTKIIDNIINVREH